MNDREMFNTIVGVLGCSFTYIFGGWDTCLIVLVVFMTLDYTTGLIGAAIQNKLNSKVGYKGIAKKASILAILIVAVLLDRLLNSNTWVFRTLVCYFYIANEGVSILENCGKCGVPVSKKILNTLEQLKEKGEE